MINFEIKNNNFSTPCGREIQSGRSMIEMLGVLAIIGVLSVGGIAGYSKAIMKYRINKTIEQITLVAGNVRTFFANQPDGTGNNGRYKDLNISVMKKAKLIPDEMWNENKTAMENAFGGSFSVYAQSNFTSQYFISLSGISQEACIELVTKDWSNANPYFVEINVEIGDALNTLHQFTYNNCTSSEGRRGYNGTNGYIACDTTMPFEKATAYCVSADNNYIGWAFH
ncbi:MAG: hypothetical protein IKO06_01975 [Alphaproteobacteria bacterium]|nr:hypothetical protein [Alphaproteobacteria bacterium]